MDIMLSRVPCEGRRARRRFASRVSVKRRSPTTAIRGPYVFGKLCFGASNCCRDASSGDAGKEVEVDDIAVLF